MKSPKLAVKDISKDGLSFSGVLIYGEASHKCPKCNQEMRIIKKPRRLGVFLNSNSEAKLIAVCDKDKLRHNL